MKRTVKKPEERRREIVAMSRMLFLEKDYENTSMQDVIDKLQIAKGTVYHYFRSKTELLDAVAYDLVEEYISQVKAAYGDCRGNALKKMQKLIKASKAKEPLLTSLESIHRPGNIVLHTRLLALTISRLAPLYAEVIQQGCQEGLFQTDYPLECAEFLLAGTQFLNDTGIYPWSSQELKRRKKALPRLLEAQLGAPKGSFNFH